MQTRRQAGARATRQLPWAGLVSAIIVLLATCRLGLSLCAHALPTPRAPPPPAGPRGPIPNYHIVPSVPSVRSAHSTRSAPIQDGVRPLVRPRVVHDATVVGVAADGRQASMGHAAEDVADDVADEVAEDVGTAWSMRGLLHGRRRPHKYSVCPVCTVVSCAVGGGCLGHCKRSAKLYICRQSGVAGGQCLDLPEDVPDPDTVPADSLSPLGSAVVEATAPFVGCANITGTADGCPAAGTQGRLADGTAFTVLNTQCHQYRYRLQCATGPGLVTPFFPYGFCWCWVRLSGGGEEWRACRTTEVDIAELGAEVRSGGPNPSANTVRVMSVGDKTVSTFGENEEVDFSAYRYSVSYTVEGENVTVRLSLEFAPQGTVDSVEEEGPIAGDYDYEPDAPLEAPVEGLP